MGGKGAKGKGAAKGAAKGAQKPWLKQAVPAKASGKGKSKGTWVFVPNDGCKGGRKGFGKSGKAGGKGKGKKRAAPLSSKFWEKKLEEEDRHELGEKTYTGTIQKYSFKFGWGFIVPDNAASLPKKVKTKLAESFAAAQAKAEESGKEAGDPNSLYFRKPDVNHEEGFKLAPDVKVTFKLYVDDKGAGAKDVSQA
eukprot:TRINITY_DN2950_c0_g1_i1.p1 TRINITY_DN2950_c0_g1~~TRINITY_DN2950_c0_g1_i1.p1  ORF type:complete len:195 (-),score=44.03 TRINITY_DN2950_c0_g1_i1:168-752(-)